MGDPIAVETLTAAAAGAVQPDLTRVLEDAVDSGASIGFVPPLAPGEALAYWRSVVEVRGARGALDANAIYYRLLE